MELRDRLLRKGENYLATKLESGDFKIHKPCYDRFNESKRTHSNSAKKRKIERGESSRVTRGQCPPFTPI